MTQRQVDHNGVLPPCANGHVARHMLDARRLEAGGGHFIECVCGRTQKHPSYELAMTEWRRAHRIRAPRQPQPSPQNVVQLGLRFKGTHRR
ncbi:hypothetical protein [Xanthomonas arboricola]|uniref:hypothetical protein n=1 Tax=Xanthomonas arboricola TaxID=56448 RepID=UPI0015E3AE8D|nr:hypothetical protein [Xanthomonas arboricola]